MKVRFEAGLENPFEHLVSHANLLLTTSVTEGFGYTFLEAWTAGKPVWGRNLADITRDFTRKGIRLDHLYQHLRVPLAWMDHRFFFTHWKDSILKNSAAFGLGLEDHGVNQSIGKILDAGLIDFGLLDEFFQKQILQILISEPSQKKRLIEINPFLANIAFPDGVHDLISHNRQVILDKFNATVYRESLLKTYETVILDTVKQHIDKHCLAASFLNPETFSLLKWGRYVE